MQRKIGLLLVWLCTFVVSLAQEVSYQEAKAKAVNFFENMEKAGGQMKSATAIQVDSFATYFTPNPEGLKLASISAKPAFYIFNRKEKPGFVFVAADERIKEILAYSNHSSFSEYNPALEGLLQQYVKEIDYAITNNLVNNCTPANDTEGTWLLGDIEWDQSKDPYNTLCPYDENATTPNKRVPAGCGATAMAQIMYYHQFPKNGLDNYSFKHSIYGWQIGQFMFANFDYAKMEPSNPKVPNEDISRLLYFCGISTDMNYAVNGSGTDVVKMGNALVRYFNYRVEGSHAGFCHIQDRNYSSIWHDLIINEIENGRPIIYLGADINQVNAHIFIIDGYKSNQLYHINWGWSGQGNGFYSLTALCPSQVDSHFITNHQMYIGIEPNNGPPQLLSKDYSSSTNTNITIKFSEPLAEKTLLNENIIIEGEKSGVHEIAKPSYDNKTWELILDPINDFVFNERVTIKLKSSITDLTNHRLDGDNNGTEGPEVVFDFITENCPQDYSVQSVTLSNSNPKAGETVTVTAVVKNSGTLAGQGFQSVQFYDNGVLKNTFSIDPILAGAENIVTFSWTATYGSHNLQVDASLAGDMDLSNNSKTIKTEINDGLTINLNSSSIVDLDAAMNSGSSRTFYINIHNPDVEDYTIDVSSESDNQNWISLTSGNKVTIPAGQTIVYSFRIYVPAQTITGIFSKELRFANAGLVIAGINISLSVKTITNQLAAYEYWFDNNYATVIRKGSPLSNNFILDESLQTSNLSNGLHTLHIRFGSNSGEWSSTITTPFFKKPMRSSNMILISGYEYWFDNEYSKKRWIRLNNPDQAPTLNEIDLSGLSTGVHTLHFRFVDDGGLWSQVNTQLINKYPERTGDQTIITYYEYWFGDNYEDRIPVSVQQQTTPLFDLRELDTKNVTPGINTLHIRYRDDAGRWSAVSTDLINIYPARSAEEPKIVRYEYWFNDNFTTKKVVEDFTPDKQYSLAKLDIKSLDPGFYQLHIRFQDDANQWSGITTSTIQKFPERLTHLNRIASYRYWIDNNSDDKKTVNFSGYPTYYILESSLNTSFINDTLDHYFHYQFLDLNGTWSAVASVKFAKRSIVPVPPVANEATLVTTSGFLASWQESTGALGYYIEVSANNDFSGEKTFDTGQSLTFTYNAPLIPGMCYYYRVKAYNSKGSGDYSNVITVTIPKGIGTIPVPVATNATNVSFDRFTANWNAIENATSYVVDVSTKSDFSVYVQGYQNKSVGLVSSLDLFALTSGTSYYYRVRAVNANGVGENSNTIEVAIPLPQKGGISVKVIETGGTNMVAYVGYEFKYKAKIPLIDTEIEPNLSVGHDEFPIEGGTVFLTNLRNYVADLIWDYKLEIVLYNSNKEKIGHIPYNYNPELEPNRIKDVILILHNDGEISQNNGTNYFPYSKSNPNTPKWWHLSKWNYFEEGEYPVSMLIPPYDNYPQMRIKKPLLFVHGVEGTYSYWKMDKISSEKSTVDLVNDKGEFHAWQIYYPKNMDIPLSAICLKYDVNYLKSLYNQKIRIYTHSMGGLVTSEYLTSNPENGKNCVEKVLFSVPPLHGSLGSNYLYKDFLGYGVEIFQGMDREAPCYRDMSLSSNFIWNLHHKDWSKLDLNGLNGIKDDFFVLLGTTTKNYTGTIISAIKKSIGQEAKDHNDVTVAISSASLLDHGIGFASMYGNHDDGKYASNITDHNFLPNFIQTYFTSSSLEGFISKIHPDKNIQAIVMPDKSIRKPGNLYTSNDMTLANLETGEEGVDYKKGIINFALPIRNMNFQILTTPDKSQLIFLPNNIGSYGSLFTIYSKLTNSGCIRVGRLDKNPNSNYHYMHLNEEVFDASYSTGCAIKLRNGKIPVTFHFNEIESTEFEIEINNCETFFIDVPQPREKPNSQTAYKTANIQIAGTSSTGDNTIKRDTAIYVNDNIQAVNFTLNSIQASESGISIVMKLKSPSGTIIDATSADIVYSYDEASGLHQIKIDNPEPGTWRIWAEATQPEAENMQFAAKAYFLSDIVPYQANDSTKALIGKQYAIEAGLKMQDLSGLEVETTKVTANIITPKGIKTTVDLSDNYIQTDTSFIFKAPLFIDTIGFYNVELNFEGICDGFRFERSLFFQIEGLDNKAYFTLPDVILNENNRFEELQLNNYISSNSDYYDTVRFVQHIITDVTNPDNLTLTLDSTRRNALIISSVADADTVLVEYSFKDSNSNIIRDTTSIRIEKVMPYTKITASKTEICQGEYVHLNVTGADKYYWSTTDTTNSIVLKPLANEKLIVYGFRNGHSTTDTINIVVNEPIEIAGIIEGEKRVLEGQQNVLYRVPKIKGAAEYQWVLPEGITGYSNADTILLGFPANSGIFEIGVKGINNCYEGGISHFSISVEKIQIQQIALTTGWNLFSLNVVPVKKDLKIHLDPMINASKLKKVMDETGKVIENRGAYGGWVNSIGEIQHTEGYKINVLSPTVLEVQGIPIALPFDIALRTGWNIISWPASGEQDAMQVFESLKNSGKLKKVMDETGKVIENRGSYGGWVNSIVNMKPGEGYKVNVLSDCILTINESGPKSAEIQEETAQSTHFVPVFKGNGVDHMNIYLVELDKSGLMEGDEIGVFDGGVCVGSTKISNQILNLNTPYSNLISLTVSADDNINEIDGFAQGNTIKLKLYRDGKEHNLVITPISSEKALFERGGSLFARVDVATASRIVNQNFEVKCYPNPFSKEITIELHGQEEILDVEIYDSLGRKIKDLYKGTCPGGLTLIWDGRNENGQVVPSGYYTIIVNYRYFKILKK